MLRTLAGLFFASTITATAADQAASFYDFALTANDGKPYPMSALRGKVVLLVNTASRCGFTKQYAGLQALYAAKSGQGLVVVGVPSNDFMGQEPGNDAEIAQFCSTKFSVTFPIMTKSTVKGDAIIPLYRWLTTASPKPGAISWNFNKYLIGRDGTVIERFGSRTAPDDKELTSAIEAALAQPAPAAPAAAAPATAAVPAP
jgi:glutathione peroxidase